MNILLVTDSYPPEIRSISYMMQELAEELTSSGHRVTVITSWPRYNLSNEIQQKPFRAFSVEKGIQVIRVKTPPHHKVNYLLRGIAQLSLPYLFFRQLKKIVKYKIDAVIVYSPPLPLTILGNKVKKIYGAGYLLNIQDIFPQNAIDLGILKNNLVIRFFEHMEKKAYKDADRITSHTENSRMFLVKKKGVPAEKITIISDWIDLDIFKDAKANGRFRERYDLKNKFIFLFAGVIGPAQNLDFVLRIAKKVEDIPEICFLLVGDGTEKNRLQKMAEEYSLQNVRFQPFVSQREYPFLVKEADVGLICLSSKNKTAVVPGKLFGFLASSIPVVAFLNKESDGHRLIQEAQCGYSSLSDNLENALNLVKKIFNEKAKLAEYGRNGYQYAAKHFSKKVCIDKLEQLIIGGSI